MRKILLACLTLAAFAAFSAPAFAEDQMDPAVMQQVMALAQPGDAHPPLAKLVGEWTMQSNC